MESSFEQRSDRNPSSAAERGELSPCHAGAGRSGVTYALRAVGGRADHAVAAAGVAASHPQLLPRHITACRGVRRWGVISRLEQKKGEALSWETPPPRGDGSALAQPEGGQAGCGAAGGMQTCSILGCSLRGKEQLGFFKSILGTKVLPKRIRNRASSGLPTHGRVTLVVI